MAAPEIAMIKIAAPHMAMRVIDRAMQVWRFHVLFSISRGLLMKALGVWDTIIGLSVCLSVSLSSKIRWTFD